MASHIVGYPRMGPKRELKFALESFWDGKSSAEELLKVAVDLRVAIWKQMADAGIKYIPSNTFSYYDQVLDTIAMLGAVPSRYNWNGGEIGFDIYFSMARGNATVPAMEMTKWFDTNYHYIVPELGPDVTFSYASHKAVEEYKEAKALGIDTIPVLVGPVSFLLLSKPAKGVERSFSLLSLIDKIIPVYKEVVAELRTAGATWIQFDEPTLVKDLDAHQLQAFIHAYAELELSLSGLNVLIETYFADVTAEAYKTLTSLKAVTAYGFDLVRGAKTLDLIKKGFPSGKFLFAGVVDGRNIWANNLASSLSSLQAIEGIVGKDRVVVSTSCSLLHTAVDLVNETKLDQEIKSWLAFAAQKIVEVNALAKALSGQKEEAFFSANAAALASRKSSPRVTNEAVQKAAAALKGSDHRRATNVSARLDAQQKKLNLPILPTTTIGSFPQHADLRRIRREFKANKISEEEYINFIKEEINKVVKLQEELDIDVLVHGEPERNDMVEYFGEQLSGFAFTANGWVQSYGSRCVKPPIIYGDVSRPKPMTVFWSSIAQSLTNRPMKGMLTGPVTILNWSFVRDDQPRFETCYQIALAIKDEVEDLEKAGITVIQIDEAALREGLPLRKFEEAFYLNWAVHSFRITNSGVKAALCDNFCSDMERDFMGLSSKESLAVVKEEIHHDGCKDSGFTKGSVVKWSFMNNVSALPHLMTFKVRQDDKTIKNVYDSFDASKRDSAGEIQGLTGVNVKQQQFGGIPVALPHSGLPTVGSIGGITGSCLKPSAASAQLTIFYAGTVNVFDGITPEKAQAIMLLAVNLLSASSNMAEAKAQAPADGAPVDHLVNTPPCACLSRPLTVSSHARAQSGSGLTSTEEFLAVKTNGVPTTPVNKVEPQKVANATTMLPSAVPQARKASLARFLEKRKERLMNAAPYNLNKKTEACPTVEHGGANFSASTTSGTNTPSTKQG